MKQDPGPATSNSTSAEQEAREQKSPSLYRNLLNSFLRAYSSVVSFFGIQLDRHRVYGLDILRAAAILMVLIGHGQAVAPVAIRKIAMYFVFDGVSIFFVLSGFLIGRILIKCFDRPDISYKTLWHFWTNRWMRTLPAYYFTLLLLLAVSAFTGGTESFWSDRLYFIFSQNIAYRHPEFFPESWSLSIEEWFYLTIPVLLFLQIRVLRLPLRKAIFMTASVIIVATLALRIFRYHHMQVADISDWDFYFRKQVVTRLDSLMFGVLGASLARYAQTFWQKARLPLFMLGLCILLAEHIRYIVNDTSYGLYACAFSFTTTAIGVLCLLPFLSTLREGNGIVYKVITYIAVISYSLYLLNLSVVQFSFLDRFEFSIWTAHLPRRLLVYPLYFFATTCGALLMYKYIEKPFMDLRRKNE